MDCSVTNTLPKPKTISVNGAVIAREIIAREVQNHPAEKPILAWQAAARALVVRELLLQEAKRLGIEAEPLRDPEGRFETPEEAAMRALDRARSRHAGARRGRMPAVLRAEPRALPLRRPL